MLFEGQICRIGQKERCEATGCEWKKHFNHNCWLRPPEVKIKIIVPKTKKTNLKEEEVLINKIKTPSQDDWIKKIKTI
jgi:hypothetical protein